LTLLAGESPEAFAARVVRQSQDPKYVPPDPDSGLLKLAGYSMAMGAVLGLSALASLGAAAALGATAETWTGVAVIGAVGNATADVGQRALDDAALRGKVSDADEYVEGAVDSAFLGAILALPARWIGLQMTPNDKNVAAAAADQASPPTGLVDDAASSATHVPAVDPSPPLDARASAAVATAGEEGATQLKPYLRAADAARDQSRLRHPGLAEDAVASGGSGHTPMSPEEVLDIAQSLKQTEGAAAGGGALTGGAGTGSAKGAHELKALPEFAGPGRVRGTDWVSQKSLLEHFEKHASEMMSRSHRSSYDLGDYVADVQRVIDTGTPVVLTQGKYAGRLNFVKFAGSDRRGKAVLEVVGLARDGRVATYTFKQARQLQNWGMKAVPSP
jgi:hypothetical protein